MILTASAELRPVFSQSLQRSLDHALAKTVSELSQTGVKPEEIAVTLQDISDASRIETASHRGQTRIYPASVIKLFYLEAAHAWMEQGKTRDTAELRRAMRDMIVDSSNDATHYVVDLLTETTGGPELAPDQIRDWTERRNAVNRHFTGQGYDDINVNQKPWCDGPYGRERAFLGEKLENRNALTTDATARLLSSIALGRSVSAKRSAEMLELLKRDLSQEPTNPDDQAKAFTAGGLPPGSKLWSKAGWTSETRHDAAYIKLPSGKKVVLVIFTVNHAKDRQIIPTLARNILAEF